MARAGAVRQVNNFTGGLVTEASPLSFPENSLSKALNVELDVDGSLSVRKPYSRDLGLCETSDVLSAMLTPSSNEGDRLVGTLPFHWKEEDILIVVYFFQSKIVETLYSVATEVFDIIEDGALSHRGTIVFDGSPQPISIQRDTYKEVRNSVDCTWYEGFIYVSIGRILFKYSLEDGTTTFDNNYQQYRDFAGVPNFSDGTGNNTFDDDYRPTYTKGVDDDWANSEVTNAHYYNLMNAGWPLDDEGYVILSGRFGLRAGDDRSWDRAFATAYWTGSFPSLKSDLHSATVTQSTDASYIGLYQPTNLDNDLRKSLRQVKRGSMILRLGNEDLTRRNLLNNNTLTPVNLGVLSDYTLWQSYQQESDTDHNVTAMEFVDGRIWYAVKGRPFNLMYSSIISKSDSYWYSKCYQAADPTDPEENNIVATDGGTISIQSTGDVYSIKQVGKSVMVFAERGIWSISGTDGGSFSPTSFSISKVSSIDVKDKFGIVETPLGIFVPTIEGLYLVSNGEFVQVTNITKDRIHREWVSFSKGISEASKLGGFFDYENQRLHFYYSINSNKDLEVSSDLKAIVFDTRLNAFYKEEYGVGFETLDQADTPQYVYDKYASTIENIPMLMYYSEGHGPRIVTMQPATTNTSGIVSFNGFQEYYFGSANENIRVWAKPDNITDLQANGRPMGDLSDFDVSNYWGPFKVEAEIPYDGVGDFSVDKIAEQAVFFLDNNQFLTDDLTSHYFRENKVNLTYTFDWDRETSGEILLGKNIRYPYQVNFDSKEVIYDKIKIPGRGHCLTLALGIPDQGSGSRGSKIAQGFKVLGYSIIYTGAGRP